ADAAAHAGVAGAEAALQVAVERPVAALGRVPHALVAGGARILETRGGARARSPAVLPARRDRDQRDQERDEDGVTADHGGQDLVIDQSTLVSSFGLMVTFSVFLPSSPCHTSTS